MTSYFLSDIHLKSLTKSLEDESSRLLLFFFQNIWPQVPGDIFLLGDIFDVWVADHSVFKEQHRELIEELKKIKRLGFDVVYFEGNHDLHLKQFWQDYLGFTVCHDVGYFEIDGRVFRLEHGDLINKADLAYLNLRRRLRSPLMSFLAHWLPGRLWKKLGEIWSQKSRRNSRTYLENKNADLVALIRNHAGSAFQEKPFDYIITGHMHIKDDVQIDVVQNGREKKIRSINLGTWLDGPKILKFRKGEFTWLLEADFGK